MNRRTLYQEVVADNRARLERLAGRGGAEKMARAYDRAEAELVRRVERGAARGSSKFTSTHHRWMLAQVRAGQGDMVRLGVGTLDQASREAQVDSLRGVVRDVRLVLGAEAPQVAVEDVARFSGVIDRRRTSLLRQHRSSMATYGARLVGQMEGDLAATAAMGGTVDDAVGAIAARAAGERWQAERIARTELSWAANATHADGAAELAKDVPDLWIRWTEHVSDDGRPLDDRVGQDSVVLHGQVVRPGGLFTMPPDPRVSASMWNQRWAHPPNRPNDRSVVVPWSPRWGAPGWSWSGGGKVPVR